MTVLGRAAYSLRRASDIKEPTMTLVKIIVITILLILSILLFGRFFI
jgi:hypothetical protein